MTTYPNLSRAWRAETVLTHIDGEVSSPRGLKTSERRWVQFAVEDPLTFPISVEGRGFVDKIGILEALSLVGQFSVPEVLTDRIQKFADYDDNGVFHGAYGARAAGALGEVVELLTRDPDSRQAVITLYDWTRDLNRVKRDIPCTLSLQFMRRGTELEMKVSMRSNDAWLGLPYDLTQFAILQATVAQALGLRPGLYVHSAGSLHVYERDVSKVEALGLPLDGEPMPFPLWSTSDIGRIASRARRWALDYDGMEAETAFEAWVLRTLFS